MSIGSRASVRTIERRVETGIRLPIRERKIGKVEGHVDFCDFVLQSLGRGVYSPVKSAIEKGLMICGCGRGIGDCILGSDATNGPVIGLRPWCVVHQTRHPPDGSPIDGCVVKFETIEAS